MRIEINTEKKTLKIFDEILLEEFIKEVSSMFPDGSWKKYKITFDKTVQILPELKHQDY